MISIIYVSSAAQLFTTDDLARLLEISRDNNAKREVTGMLLYKDGNFMQVIEGEEPNVRGLYEKLQLDPRHTGFLTLLEEKISRRQFEDWSMGFKNLDDPALSQIEGYRDYKDVSFLNQAFSAQPSRAKKLLEIFRQKM
jgi:hypothetical protein